MKVDIIGHYKIPALRLVAPANGVELNIQQLKLLLKYKNLLVMVADTSTRIDLRNVDMLYNKFNGKQKDIPHKIQYTKPEVLNVIPKQKHVVVETVENDIKVDTVTEVTTDVVDEKVDESVTDEKLESYEEPEISIEEQPTVEEQPVVKEETTQHNNFKKRNKKRNRNNG